VSLTAPGAGAVAAACPHCGAAVAPADSFCENCGSSLSPVAVAADLSGSALHCAQCSGDVADDGYCTQCGTRAATPRDHWKEQPSEWLAGVCDKGIVHTRNEDAMALAEIGGASAVIVVCDGVTSAPDSDKASIAAARTACASIVSALTSPAAAPPADASPVAVQRTPGDDIAFVHTMVQMAAVQANGAVVDVAHKLGDPVDPPSCTFVAAVIVGADTVDTAPTIVVGWCGDSRAYWIADAGDGLLLTTDHSLGTEMVRSGMSRAEVESDPTYHTITRWLGADSVDTTAEVVHHTPSTSGWLVVCSDGLWNYASTPEALQAAMVLAAGAAALSAADPVALAAELVRFANEQGGRDNITAAVARVTVKA
jgi:serine/threonine protein phosphatase PrpC